PDQYAWLVDRISDGRWIAYALFAIAFLLPVARYLFNLRRPSVRITYPGRENIRALKGATLLEISRANGIAHASVCGGRARCSTCRTLIVEHTGDLPPPGEAELRVLKRIDADSRVRLACQLRPTGDMVVQPIMPAQDSLAVAGNRQDVYHWGIEKPAVIMFADMRNFTGMSEERLPYDVVFLLNRYLQLMSEAITGAGGQVDKFIGDGIMAIFGISEPIPVAARQAFQAAAAMAEALDRLNAESGLDAAHRIRIGIGLHAGPVILGRIGAAGAGAAPAAITALGDTVNAASRLETATKDFDVLLVASQNVLRAAGLSPEDGKHATIAVKGKRRSIDIVAIADPRALQAQLNEPAA
ncbi:MAG: adenylate/guanylate cyclase domain-containing protein, partial [Rhodobiaceae bacterium]|nr:adenylate/guanylate cyclase domain-containing protein [Rhodobiaceae bacterium]